MAKWLVEVPVTVIVSVVVKAKDEERAAERFGLDDLIYTDSMGGIALGKASSLYFDSDGVNWGRVEVSATDDADEAANDEDEDEDDEPA